MNGPRSVLALVFSGSILLKLALRSERPAALEEKHFQFIRDQLKANSFLSSYGLARLYNSQFKSNRVHRSTVLRAMRDLGYSLKKRKRLTLRIRASDAAAWMRYCGYALKLL